MKYEVNYEVRNLGAIGVFWTLTDVVEADDSEQAKQVFRTKHQAHYEFRSPIRVRPMTPAMKVKVKVRIPVEVEATVDVFDPNEAGLTGKDRRRDSPVVAR